MEKLRTTSKITLATLKAFIARNEGKLYINHLSAFDGMEDMVTQHKDSRFEKVTKIDSEDCELRINRFWIVGIGRDYYKMFEDDNFIGIETYNSCGHAVVAIKK